MTGLTETGGATHQMFSCCPSAPADWARSAEEVSQRAGGSFLQLVDGDLRTRPPPTRPCSETYKGVRRPLWKQDFCLGFGLVTASALTGIWLWKGNNDAGWPGAPRPAEIHTLMHIYFKTSAWVILVRCHVWCMSVALQEDDFSATVAETDSSGALVCDLCVFPQRSLLM